MNHGSCSRSRGEHTNVYVHQEAGIVDAILDSVQHLIARSSVYFCQSLNAHTKNGDRMLFYLMGLLGRSNEVNYFAKCSTHVQLLPTLRSVLNPTFSMKAWPNWVACLSLSFPIIETAWLTHSLYIIICCYSRCISYPSDKNSKQLQDKGLFSQNNKIANFFEHIGCIGRSNKHFLIC